MAARERWEAGKLGRRLSGSFFGGMVRAYFAQASRLLAVQDALPEIAEYLAVPGFAEGGFLQVGNEGETGMILGAGDEVAIGADVCLDER